MTLHWWMHWFWVTSLLMLLESSGRALAAPQSEELQHITTDVETDLRRQMDRQGRAMYYTKTPSLTTAKTPALNTSTNQTDKELDTANVTTDNSTVEIVHPSIQWIPTNASDLNFNDTSTPSNVTVTNATVVSSNATEEQNATFTSKKRNLTRLDFVKDDTSLEGASESRIVTEKPLSLETAFVQTRIPPNVESSRRIKDPGEGDMDMGAIAGISFAALVLAALAGSTAFVLYRRRYLNKPQTLNDKCSNPDSSGYLDDSTIRDNSEEMYSLDNDSFLNSLEAMTIQNYWTDTVKHTKL
ncbi:uncharacterized protein LOC114350123 [Ostrinia furnacalis]|uniref:uncharacterized protein LOC114350123 n=1 Tax=Ostrinia furnacalis TaxID=93504 RepID=UPI00103EF642|nr:uncharacterized protein LOC114350123 [Ostrinia furnacalis]